MPDAPLHSQFARFQELLESGNDHAASEWGERAFKQLASSLDDVVPLADVRTRLRAARRIHQRVTAFLRKVGDEAANSQFDDPVVPRDNPAAPTGSSPDKVCAPERIYNAHRSTFGPPLRIEGLNPPVAEFVESFYNLRIRIISREIAAACQPTEVPSDRRLVYPYVLILPLLKTEHDFLAFEDIDFLASWNQTPRSLDILEEFCLIKAGRIDAAVAVARISSDGGSAEFDRIDFLLASADRCMEARRIDIAEECLRLALASAKSKGSDKRLDAALKKTDDLLLSPNMKKHQARLEHLRWRILRRLDRPVDAARAMKHFLARHRDNPLAAEMYYAAAIDLLSIRNFEEIVQFADILIYRFPESDEAKKAVELRDRINRLKK